MWLGQRSEAPVRRRRSGGGLAGRLFGRWTYEHLLSHWNSQPDSPFAPALNNTPKYVVSTALTEPLPWPNSTLLRGDVPEAVGTLKAQSNGVMAMMGSGQLISSLMAADLVDEYLLMIHPMVLGTGRRLFPEGVDVKLRLTDSVATPTGVVIATYEPARDKARPGRLLVVSSHQTARDWLSAHRLSIGTGVRADCPNCA